MQHHHCAKITQSHRFRSEFGHAVSTHQRNRSRKSNQKPFIVFHRDRSELGSVKHKQGTDDIVGICAGGVGSSQGVCVIAVAPELLVPLFGR